MSGIIASLIPSLGGYAVAALGILAAIVMAFLRGRSDGRKIEQGRHDRQRVESIGDRKNVEEAVRQMGTDDLDREYDRWVQDDKPR